MPTIEITKQGPTETARGMSANWYENAYKRNLSLSQLLERMDPTSERKADDPDRGLDAYERVLKASGIVTQPVNSIGLQSSTWEEATDTPEKRALMPEFMARVWRRAGRLGVADRERLLAGQEGSLQARTTLLSDDYALGSLANPWFDDPTIRATRLVPPVPLERLLARTAPIEGSDSYRSIFINDALGTDAYRLKRVAEATTIPTTTMITGERNVRLYKYGRALKASYEQIRRMRIDRVAFIMARMSLQAENDKVAMVLSTVLNGDGNANTSAAVLNQTALHPGSSSGTLTLQAWLTFKIRFTLGYQPDVLLAQEGPMVSLLLLPLNQANTMPLGMITAANPFGTLAPFQSQMNYQINWGITADAPASKLVAWQSPFTIERLVEVGGSVQEVDRFIHDQTQLLTVSEVEGYAIIDPNAGKVLNIAA